MNVNLSLYHLVRQPEVADKRPPLLILLHGFGSNEEDLFSLAPYLDPRFLILSVRAPYTLAYAQYAWYHMFFHDNGIDHNIDEAKGSLERLVQFIRESISVYNPDPRQVYLMGFSQGATMDLTAMLSEPELLAGVVAMSGMLPHDILARVAAPERLNSKLLPHRLHVMMLHGLYDDVLPIAQGRAARDYLSALPITLDYREYPMGHQITPESLDDACNWLAQQLQ